MNLVHAMYLNSAYEPLSKTEVRQALCYAVDRDAINNFIFGGKSHIIGSHMIPAMSKYYEPEAETVYSYDPEKAKSFWQMPDTQMALIWKSPFRAHTAST